MSTSSFLRPPSARRISRSPPAVPPESSAKAGLSKPAAAARIVPGTAAAAPTKPRLVSAAAAANKGSSALKLRRSAVGSAQSKAFPQPGQPVKEARSAGVPANRQPQPQQPRPQTRPGTGLAPRNNNIAMKDPAGPLRSVLKQRAGVAAGSVPKVASASRPAKSAAGTEASSPDDAAIPRKVSKPADARSKPAVVVGVGAGAAKRRPLVGLCNQQVNAGANRRKNSAEGSEDPAIKKTKPLVVGAPPAASGARIRRSVDGLPVQAGGSRAAALRHRRSVDKPADLAPAAAEPGAQESLDLFEQMMEAALAQGSINAGATPRVLLKSPPPRKPRNEYSPVRRRQLLDDERYFVCTKVIHDLEDED